MEEKFVQMVFQTPVATIRNWDSRIDFDKEIILELSHSPVSQPQALPQINLVDIKLKLNSNRLQHEMARIPAENFYTLYNAADQMKTSGSTEKYVTGLKVHFGAKVDSQGNHELLPVYQPIITYRRNAKSADFDVTKKGEYYYYDGNNFTPYRNQDEAKKLKDAYKSKIEILRFGQLDPSNYDCTKGDVEATIFPFQTIYALIVHNLNYANTTNVYLYNSIHEDTEFRHCVLLATREEGARFMDFINKFANRSQLCPPCTIKWDL